MVMFQKFGLESTPIFKHFELTNLNYPPHFHRAFEVIAVQRGQLHVKIEDQQYIINRHQFVVIFPDQIHGFNMRPQTKVTEIIFSPELVASFIDQYPDMVPTNPVFFYRQSFDFSTLENRFAIKGFLYSICGLIISRTSLRKRKKSKKVNIIHQLINFISEHYHEECTLKIAAKNVGYDYAYLSRIFKTAIGMSFTEYLNHYRITQATQLLKNTEEKVTNIAFQVGYENLQTFNRNFQKIVGMRPNIYRHSNDNSNYQKAFQENYISG